MDFTFTLYEVEPGYFGYRFQSADGSIRARQDFAPGIGNRVLMTEAEARTYAAAAIAELEAAVEPTTAEGS
ncbi:hypothetical protein D3C71_328590 [compost metagenome]